MSSYLAMVIELLDQDGAEVTHSSQLEGCIRLRVRYQIGLSEYEDTISSEDIARVEQSATLFVARIPFRAASTGRVCVYWLMFFRRGENDEQEISVETIS